MSFLYPVIGYFGHLSSQVMGATPTRVPFPLDLSTEDPVYVNAKQYRGILRRRQHRAKLEAHNRLAKNRKPYLHESRHQHAVKRARGTGGRFLNKSALQSSNSSPLCGKIKEPGVCQQEHIRQGTSTNSGSVATSLSTNVNIYRPSEFRFYDHTSRIEEPVQGGGGHYL
ncbi:hypothetical protein vseg_010241 [Gypsophila vaccaria]